MQVFVGDILCIGDECHYCGAQSNIRQEDGQGSHVKYFYQNDLTIITDQ